MLAALAGILGLLTGLLLTSLLAALLATLIGIILLLLITHFWLLEGPLPGATTLSSRSPFRSLIGRIGLKTA